MQCTHYNIQWDVFTMFPTPFPCFSMARERIIIEREYCREFDFLPRLKAWDSYTVRLNGGLRFGGFPRHWR